MDENQPLPGVERWCLGQRATGTRPLTAEEIEALRRETRRLRIRALVPLPLFTTSWAVLLWAWTSLGHFFTCGDVWLGALVFLPLLLGLPIAILLTRDCLRAAADAQRDIGTGTADCFGGERPDDGASNDTSVPIVLRSASLRILHGPPDMIGEEARVTRIAAGAATAWRVPIRLPDGVPTERRRLSASECAELRKAIRDWRRVRFGSLFAIAWVGVLVFAFVNREPGPIGLGDGFVSILSAALCLAALSSNARRILASFAMDKDLSEGFALMIRGASGEEEILPQSGVLWWANGAPADWRDLGDS